MRLGFTQAGRADFKKYGNDAIEDIKARVPEEAGLSLAPDNYEGVRIVFSKDEGDGWALVRMSLHEPIMPINFESNSVGGGRIIAQKLAKMLEGYPFLNSDNLKK